MSNFSSTFQFDWFRGVCGTPMAKYIIFLHTSFEDRFDMYARQPNHQILKNRIYNIKLSKTKFDSLDQEESPCSSDLLYGPLRCKILKTGWKLIEKYNCTLPWMSAFDFPDINPCEVGTIPNKGPEHEDLDFIPYYLIVKNWGKIYKNTKDCTELLPCKRTVYQDLIEQQSSKVGYEHFGGTGHNMSSLTIQYANPYIQVIKDSNNYDMQSLIGEVGGTLGLLLGLSFISIFDLFEHILNSCFNPK